MLKDFNLFLNEFCRNFTFTGAIAPSSPMLARAVIEPLRGRPQRSIKVLEVGPGTGAMTLSILKHLRAGDWLDIYELNPKFYTYLRKRLRKNNLSGKGIQCCLYNQDIRKLNQPIQYDYIVSSLPLANFNHQMVSEIMEIYLKHLAEDGVLSYFEYSLPSRWKLPFLKPRERERVKRVARTVKHYVKQHQYHCSHVWMNLPPAWARHFRKNLVSRPLAEHT